MSKANPPNAKVGDLLDALKALLDLHDLALVASCFPADSKGGQMVLSATAQARRVLQSSRKYGACYRDQHPC